MKLFLKAAVTAAQFVVIAFGLAVLPASAVTYDDGSYDADGSATYGMLNTDGTGVDNTQYDQYPCNPSPAVASIIGPGGCNAQTIESSDYQPATNTTYGSTVGAPDVVVEATPSAPGVEGKNVEVASRSVQTYCAKHNQKMLSGVARTVHVHQAAWPLEGDTTVRVANSAVYHWCKRGIKADMWSPAYVRQCMTVTGPQSGEFKQTWTDKMKQASYKSDTKYIQFPIPSGAIPVLNRGDDNTRCSDYTYPLSSQNYYTRRSWKPYFYDEWHVDYYTWSDDNYTDGPHHFSFDQDFDIPTT